MADNATLKAIAFSAALAGGEYYDQNQSYKVPEIVEPEAIVKEVVKVKHIKLEESHHRADKSIRESVGAIKDHSKNSDVIAYIKDLESKDVENTKNIQAMAKQLGRSNTALKRYLEATK